MGISIYILIQTINFVYFVFFARPLYAQKKTCQAQFSTIQISDIINFRRYDGHSEGHYTEA